MVRQYVQAPVARWPIATPLSYVERGKTKLVFVEGYYVDTRFKPGLDVYTMHTVTPGMKGSVLFRWSDGVGWRLGGSPVVLTEVKIQKEADAKGKRGNSSSERVKATISLGKKGDSSRRRPR